MTSTVAHKTPNANHLRRRYRGGLLRKTGDLVPTLQPSLVHGTDARISWHYAGARMHL